MREGVTHGRAIRWATGVLLSLQVAACVGAAADHEVLGDRAYADERFDDALVEYRLALTQAAPQPALRVKAAAAALRARDLYAAVEEYLALARNGGDSAASEAADGLERVGQAAVEAGDQSALAAALAALEQLAPERTRGEFALQLAREIGSSGPPEEVLSILLYAAAAAPDARLQDSLMYAYAETLRRNRRCPEAIPVYESLLRRARDSGVVQRSRVELAQCARTLGVRVRTDALAWAGTGVP